VVFFIVSLGSDVVDIHSVGVLWSSWDLVVPSVVVVVGVSIVGFLREVVLWGSNQSVSILIELR
jgi:hypothetical protein